MDPAVERSCPCPQISRPKWKTGGIVRSEVSMYPNREGEGTVSEEPHVENMTVAIRGKTADAVEQGFALFKLRYEHAFGRELRQGDISMKEDGAVSAWWGTCYFWDFGRSLREEVATRVARLGEEVDMERLKADLKEATKAPAQVLPEVPPPVVRCLVCGRLADPSDGEELREGCCSPRCLSKAKVQVNLELSVIKTKELAALRRLAEAIWIAEPYLDTFVAKATRREKWLGIGHGTARQFDRVKEAIGEWMRERTV